MASRPRLAFWVSAHLLLAISAVTMVPAPASSESRYPYLEGTRLTDNKCNAAFNRYLSCFFGDNLKRCIAKIGKASCNNEKAAARGDLAVAYSMNEVFGEACAPETFQMIEKNLRAYKELWGCEPRDAK